jgi:hypothetical protein
VFIGSKHSAYHRIVLSTTSMASSPFSANEEENDNLQHISRNNDAAESITSSAKDAKEALLTVVSMKFDRDFGSMMNWNVHTPLEQWRGIKSKARSDGENVILHLDIGEPVLQRTLRIEEIGPRVLTSHLLVLKIVDSEKVPIPIVLSLFQLDSDLMMLKGQGRPKSSRTLFISPNSCSQ